MALQVVPQWIVDVLASVLVVGDRNLGAILGEQIMRTDPASGIILRIAAEPLGTAVAPADAAQLPALGAPGLTWGSVADRLRIACQIGTTDVHALVAQLILERNQLVASGALPPSPTV